jgi:hypothetical protein
MSSLDSTPNKIAHQGLTGVRVRYIGCRSLRLRHGLTNYPRTMPDRGHLGPFGILMDHDPNGFTCRADRIGQCFKGGRCGNVD